jgi:hypothetical protein
MDDNHYWRRGFLFVIASAAGSLHLLVGLTLFDGVDGAYSQKNAVVKLNSCSENVQVFFILNGSYWFLT